MQKPMIISPPGVTMKVAIKKSSFSSRKYITKGVCIVPTDTLSEVDYNKMQSTAVYNIITIA